VPLYTTEDGLATLEIVKMKMKLAEYPGYDKYQRPQVLPKLSTIRRSQSVSDLDSSQDGDIARVRGLRRFKRHNTTGGSHRHLNLTKRNSDPLSAKMVYVPLKEIDDVETTSHFSNGSISNGSIGSHISNHSISNRDSGDDVSHRTRPAQLSQHSDFLGLDGSILRGSAGTSVASRQSSLSDANSNDFDAHTLAQILAAQAQPTPPQRPPKIRQSASFSSAVLGNTGERWNTWLKRRMDGSFPRLVRHSRSRSNNDISNISNSGSGSNSSINTLVSQTLEDDEVDHVSEEDVGGDFVAPCEGKTDNLEVGNVQKKVAHVVKSESERKRKSKRVSMTNAAVVVPMTLSKGAGEGSSSALPPKPPKPSKLSPIAKQTTKRWWHALS
jgi:hypothetical protein